MPVDRCRSAETRRRCLRNSYHRSQRRKPSAKDPCRSRPQGRAPPMVLLLFIMACFHFHLLLTNVLIHITLLLVYSTHCKSHLLREKTEKQFWCKYAYAFCACVRMDGRRKRKKTKRERIHTTTERKNSKQYYAGERLGFQVTRGTGRFRQKRRERAKDSTDLNRAETKKHTGMSTHSASVACPPQCIPVSMTVVVSHSHSHLIPIFDPKR